LPRGTDDCDNRANGALSKAALGGCNRSPKALQPQKESQQLIFTSNGLTVEYLSLFLSVENEN